MSEHLGNAERAVMTSSVLALCDYTCEWADDATLFALMATLASHAAQVAARMDQEHYMGPQPSDMAQAQMALSPSVRLTGVHQAENGPC